MARVCLQMGHLKNGWLFLCFLFQPSLDTSKEALLTSGPGRVGNEGIPLKETIGDGGHSNSFPAYRTSKKIDPLLIAGRISSHRL